MKVAVFGSIFVEYNYTIPKIPLAGEAITADAVLMREGGRGQNQAVTMAKLEGDVKMIGAVGSDDSGEICLNSLKSYGIKTDGVIVKAGEITGRKVINTDYNGVGTSVIYPGATKALSEKDLPFIFEQLKDVDSILMQFEIPMEVIYPVLKYCHEKGITTFVNPAPAIKKFDSDYFKYIDYLIPNEVELFFTAESLIDMYIIEEACKKIYEKGTKHIIVTLGQAGSLYYDGNTFVKIPALKVESKDTKCVGDSFVGALTIGIIKGKAILAAIEYATKAAAITISNTGGLSALPYEKDLEQ